VLHRAPDADRLAYWTDIVNSHAATLDQVLASFSESPENQQALATVIGAGVVYQPYL
jgi:hypothetical protein